MIGFIMNQQAKYCKYGFAEAQYLSTHGPKRLFLSALGGIVFMAVPYLLFQAAILLTFTPLVLHRFARRIIKRD